MNADGEAGCGYYRILQPLGEIARHGHHVNIIDLWTDERVTNPDHDVFVAQRLGDPASDEFTRWSALAAHGALVYEVDDDMFAVHQSHPRAYPIVSNPELRRDMARCIAVSDLVTVSTEPLAETVGKWHPNVVVLPNHIDAALLEQQRPRRERLTVGWSGGDSHLIDLQLVAPQLRRCLDRNPHIDMHFIGVDYSKLVKRTCRFTPFQLGVWNYYPNIDFDIGLSPLAPVAFNRSKSHIRCLEYAALGIPVIASDEPAYRDFVVDGVTGFLVRYDHEWGQRLWELVNDEAMRDEMGAKAKVHAAQWTIQDGWRRWEDAYRKALT